MPRSKTRRQVSTDISLHEASGESWRLAVSSSPPPLSFEQLGLPRQRPAGRGTLEGTCSEFTSSHPVPSAVWCAAVPVAHVVPHVKKNVRSITALRPYCWVRACKWRGMEKVIEEPPRSKRIWRKGCRRRRGGYVPRQR